MSTSLSEEDIAEVIAGWTGIPLTKINETESEKLLSLEDTYMRELLGKKMLLIQSVKRLDVPVQG